MKKTTKSLWLYAAILFIIAIVLIITATLLQARVISTDTGKIEVLGTFTQDIKQSVNNLTEENVKLTNELHAANDQNSKLQAELDGLKATYEKEIKNKDTVNKMYSALKRGDSEELEALLTQITSEEADTFIKGLYKDAKREVESANEENE